MATRSTEERYTVAMTDSTSIYGRLVALHWPSQSSEATLSLDLDQNQQAIAEIEDSNGTTHRVEVHVNWEADSLVGKIVKTSFCDNGTSLCASQ